MPSHLSPPGPLSPEEAADRVLLERIRLAAKIVIMTSAATLLGELVLLHAERPRICMLQAANLLAVALVLALARAPEQRRRNLVLCFVGYLVTTLCITGVGILGNDPTTALLVLTALALCTAMFIPWGARWQALAVVPGTGVTIVITVTLLRHLPNPWVQNVGAVLGTLVASVFIAHALSRQRAVVMRTEHDHLATEATLREAKRTLEREVEEHRRTEDTLRFALRELDHRVKNTLAIVQSVAESTLETSQSPAEFGRAFHGRIQAMARIHSALAARKWEGLMVRELIELAVGPYRPREDSISVDADGATVSSDVARTLAMALHELATNAAKYGALSTPEGHVRIESRFASPESPHLHLIWAETRGPPVTAPKRRGLGLTLIEEGVAYESGGTVVLQFPPTGAYCEIDIPIRATPAYPKHHLVPTR